MSKIGKMPVKIPKGVTVKLDGSKIDVSGPNGKLNRVLHDEIQVKVEEDSVIVTRPSDQKFHRSLHGLTRALIQNMVTGVSEGYKIELEMIGVGYRAEMKGKLLELNLGFSHPIVLRAPDEIKLEVFPKESKIVVTGADKQLVGQTAAQIRSFRPPEPYKGKGVRYVGEKIRRKAGKAAGK
ncbi:MAG: 50S ribosomal protein L6 [Candidatus Zixiibacteriota bacterium]|nr:MAG: 50S ribosomal protein L6 [candidate division Zixibacteria bacterium]HDL04089.1 50S ribosomal protein L6 [candidate division Zixibacteria bacterium]